jgi:hypothetical protein
MLRPRLTPVATRVELVLSYAMIEVAAARADIPGHSNPSASTVSVHPAGARVHVTLLVLMFRQQDRWEARV